MKYSHDVSLSEIVESVVYFHVYVLVNTSVEEGCDDIHLMQFQGFRCNHGQYNAYGGIFEDVGVYLTKFNAEYFYGSESNDFYFGTVPL